MFLIAFVLRLRAAARHRRIRRAVSANLARAAR